MEMGDIAITEFQKNIHCEIVYKIEQNKEQN